MKKPIAIIITLVSIYMLLQAFGVGQAIVLFLTIGLIPGTEVTLSPDSMLAIITASGSIIIASLIFQHTFQYLIVRYYVIRWYRRQATRITRAMQYLDHLYQWVQSIRAKAVVPEE